MIHKILFHVIPFLLPFIAYGLYLFATRRARKKEEIFNEAPWYWLFVAGLVLMAMSLISLWLFAGDPADAQYTAPHVRNGQVVPGQFNNK